METYYNSIGRNGTLLLNFPIMPNGLIHEADEKAVLEFRATVEASFAENLAKSSRTNASNLRGNSIAFGADKTVDGDNGSYWATHDSITKASLTMDFDAPILFNRFLIQEYIRLGQRVKSFTVEALVNGNWVNISEGTTIGYKRILRFPSVMATKVRLNIVDAKSSPLISTIGIYNAPVFLSAPNVKRNQFGDISITTNDIGPYFYYTLDGSNPTTASKRYNGAVPTDGKVVIKAIAFDPDSGKSSPVTTEQFDINRTDWKILNIDNENASAVLDGDIETTWHPSRDTTLPYHLDIDLGSEQQLIGFRYHPDQNMWDPGIITQYEFYVSTDNKSWKLVDQGEFSNIRNNPVWQIRKFTPQKGRFIRFRALKNAEGTNNVEYAEIDVITDK